jgi:SCP-2 sterol transfer family protein
MAHGPEGGQELGPEPLGIIRAAGGAPGTTSVRHHSSRAGVDVATKRQVETKLRQLIKRLDQANHEVRGSLAESLPETRIIEVVIPDLETSYWTELDGGRMDGLHEGSPRQAEIRVRVSSDHLVELVDGRRSLFSAYLAGQVSIDASFSDLLRLRKLA